MELQAALQSGKFKVKTLTASINNVETPKTRLAELGIFEEKGIRTTSVEIEFKDGQIMIVPEKERGADGTDTNDRTRKTVTIKATHLPLTGQIMADDVLNLRAFASENELEELQTLIDEKQEDHKMSLDATIEFHRMGALLGKVKGANGGVILDLFSAFGIKEADGKDTVDFNKPLKTQLLGVKRNSEKHQKGIKGKVYRGLCKPDYFDQMLEDPEFVKAFDRYQNGAVLRDDVRSGVYYQGVYWEEYNPEVVEGKDFLDGNDAIVFPVDKPKMFLTRFAPANYNETAGTTGLPFYGNSEPLPMDKGIKLESQSNPINVCTSPLAVRRIKMTAKTTN
ncbi:major capsid protein [Pseudoalteromonas sp. MMG024]|uniref:major capsid protein n=1 Tax=Pseudoalteromonas sp. MMG024 TaxID=2909980 RepID=UPI001F1E376A|nr:major capsid protein [Pseudoalteromonas sp. MMG024]MCF6459048.1 major capsid protein [Pseudoalteromonas sp. MMG024]